MSDLLLLREQRFYREQELQKRGTVVTIKANVPGRDKRWLWSDYAVYVLYTALTTRVSPHFVEAEHQAEGLVFVAVFSEEAYALKQQCVELEERHPLGRMVDLDVRTGEDTLSRTEIGYPRRKCYLCDEDAVICSRSRRHSLEELRGSIREMVWQYLNAENPLPRFAQISLLSELCRPLGFGCVTVNHTGSHQDMDFFTFLRSLPVVAASLEKVTGEMDFPALRNYGCGVEQRMFQATRGINTHKGAVFLYLLLAAAYLRTTSTDTMPATLQILAKPIGEDFARKPDSHGLKLYRKHGVRGIRGEAQRGFPLLFVHDKIPETPEEFNRLSLQLMGQIEDTNAMHRAGMEGWRQLKQRARKVLSGEMTAEALDGWCLEKNISTGGTADLVGGAVFIQLLKEKERKWGQRNEN